MRDLVTSTDESKTMNEAFRKNSGVLYSQRGRRWVALQSPWERHARGKVVVETLRTQWGRSGVAADRRMDAVVTPCKLNRKNSGVTADRNLDLF